MRKKRVGVLCCIALVGVSQLGAQSKPASTGITVSGYGVGMERTCGAFLRETSEQDTDKALEHEGKLYHLEHRLYFEWLSGFLTARSLYGRANPKGSPNMNDMMIWVRRYCETHPLDDFFSAARQLAIEVSKP